MKDKFVIFYSWMSDRPKKQNIKFIRKVLNHDCNKLAKEFGVKIVVDSDSRSEDGSKPIEESILKKITECDLFVGDITPIFPHCPLIWWDKPTPNPNVMYELGFAVSSLGWNRCIMVWNSKYGAVGKAPFDIRNHSTVSYKIGKNELSLYKVLKSKIEHFDEYEREWRTGKERSFDAEKYAEITKICSERNLVESIHSFLTNLRYNAQEFDWWEDLIYSYRYYPDNHFVDDDINQAYQCFLGNLNRMTCFAAVYNKKIRQSKRPDDEFGSEEWKREEVFKIIDPYDMNPESEAKTIQARMDAEYKTFAPQVLDSYNTFRDLIRKKLLI